MEEHRACLPGRQQPPSTSPHGQRGNGLEVQWEGSGSDLDSFQVWNQGVWGGMDRQRDPGASPLDTLKDQTGGAGPVLPGKWTAKVFSGKH